MRPEQAGPEGDEIAEQECSAFCWIQAMDAVANQNQIFELGSDGGGQEGGVCTLGSLCPSLEALPWDCVCPSPPRKEWVCGSACWFPLIVVWSIFYLGVLERSVGLGHGLERT